MFKVNSKGITKKPTDAVVVSFGVNQTAKFLQSHRKPN